ncbi:NADH-ubiquinone oxidoreductase chain J [Labilithrix luteola]|uniref:NADH-quinone oxidoreductase subunit J n=1 Tax=Labilithrix luteola TaxID=1391654 RepID=A0A0K1Q8F9_9BACT|nr:NADH-quinone oxidoreductase subunit J [Labilithrix luteola]AKV02028.1 NADH-ubiquinone oxidoreductase chain J [Labilithrix luteola]
MNSTELALGQAYFWVCAVVALAGALFTVIAKNPIRGAMGLLLMILCMAGLFLALHAQFLAAIQLIVYAGAIVVLFLFVIMLLGPSATPPTDSRGRIPRAISAALFAGGGLAAMILLVRSAPVVPAAQKAQLLADVPTDFGSVEKFGNILFGPALVPFELSSALLMVAIVGAVAVARGRTKADLPHNVEEPAEPTDATAQRPEAHS